jgi:peroxin-14
VLYAQTEDINQLEQMIEKHAASQTAALQDLQSELRSLKTLLQSRQAGATTPATKEQGGSNTQAAANALLTPRGKGIPAWQLPSNKHETRSPGSSGGSMSGSGTIEKDESA